MSPITEASRGGCRCLSRPEHCPYPRNDQVGEVGAWMPPITPCASRSTSWHQQCGAPSSPRRQPPSPRRRSTRTNGQASTPFSWPWGHFLGHFAPPSWSCFNGVLRESSEQAHGLWPGILLLGWVKFVPSVREPCPCTVPRWPSSQQRGSGATPSILLGAPPYVPPTHVIACLWDSESPSNLGPHHRHFWSFSGPTNPPERVDLRVYQYLYFISIHIFTLCPLNNNTTKHRNNYHFELFIPKATSTTIHLNHTPRPHTWPHLKQIINTKSWLPFVNTYSFVTFWTPLLYHPISTNFIYISYHWNIILAFMKSSIFRHLKM